MNLARGEKSTTISHPTLFQASIGVKRKKGLQLVKLLSNIE
jgi:hypothetical protein